MAGLVRRLAAVLPNYVEIAWWGLVAPRVERRPLVVYQGVVLSEDDGRVLLAVRGDLRGWELPGGNGLPGESARDALAREIREETGLLVEVGRHVGDYVRTGFRPHTAEVYVCRPRGGALRPSDETPVVRWFDPAELPATLFPWYRAPLADALAGAEGVERSEHQGVEAIWAGLSIDLRMRVSDDRAGLPEGPQREGPPV